METIAAGTETRASGEVGTHAPILAATDGTKQSEGALAMARFLAEANGASLAIVAVQRPVTLVVPEAPLLLEKDIVPRLAMELKERARLQCAEMAQQSSGLALPEPEVISGEPERVIPRVATEKGVQLIVVGIGRHHVMDRIFGSETALKVARTSRVPVLAVPDAFRGPVHSALVGVDFSEASVRAAQETVHLVASAGGGIVHLVHVIPRDRLLLDPWLSDREYDEIVRHRFTRLRARLNVAPNVALEQTTCTGDVARALIEYAQRVSAEVIAAGSHGHGVVSRVVLGSVTTALLRAAHTAVLVVPPTAAGATVDAASRTVHVEPSQWVAVLADFSRANAGRRTRLEIDDPDIGAQAQESDYPLLGIAFDPHDRQLEIMLGADSTGGPHLSHTIRDMTSLDLLSDTHGTDVALSAGHGRGQTMLTFLSS